jgi:hypothetical protein
LTAPDLPISRAVDLRSRHRSLPTSASGNLSR